MEPKVYESIMDDYETLMNHIGWIHRERFKDILMVNEYGTLRKKNENEIRMITADDEKEISGMLDDVIENLFDTMGGTNNE
jgi:hypothetical protein